MDDGGHDGLRFHQFRERVVRRPRRTRRIGQHLRPLRRPTPRFPRGGAPIEAADLPHGDVERFAVARPPAQSHLRAAPPLARFHAQRAADRAARNPGLLSRSTAPTSTATTFPSKTGRSSAGRWRRRNAATPRSTPRCSTSFATCCCWKPRPIWTRPAATSAICSSGRFQQVTSPVMAKGIEDTAFYRYLPLASLNEVGGDPARGATSLANSIATIASAGRLAAVAHCSTTHDTKRSEDARARIDVLSEIPHLWRKAVNRWARLNRRHRGEVDGQPAPSRNDEYLFYQNLVGVWPLLPLTTVNSAQLTGRMVAYMEKATHEAKVHTSWINPDAEYDAAVQHSWPRRSTHHAKNRFLADFRQFHEQIVGWGLYNALSQTPPETHFAGRARRLSRPGTLGFQPRRPRQPPAGRFCRAAKDARPAAKRRRPRRSLAALAGRRARPQSPRPADQAVGHLAGTPVSPATRRAFPARRLRAVGRRRGKVAARLCASPVGCPNPSDAGPQIAVAVVPRLIAQLTPAADSLPPPPPLGSAIWADTRIILEGDWPATLKNVFTGRDCPVGRLPHRLGRRPGRFSRWPC